MFEKEGDAVPISVANRPLFYLIKLAFESSEQKGNTLRAKKRELLVNILIRFELRQRRPTLKNRIINPRYYASRKVKDFQKIPTFVIKICNIPPPSLFVQIDLGVSKKTGRRQVRRAPPNIIKTSFRGINFRWRGAVKRYIGGSRLEPYYLALAGLIDSIFFFLV